MMRIGSGHWMLINSAETERGGVAHGVMPMYSMSPEFMPDRMLP